MRTSKKNNIHIKDWKYVPAEPDPDFDADRNRRIIARTIKKAEANRRRKQREHDEGVKERTDALATYIESLKQGKTQKGVEEYFGRKELARLRGKEIVERIQDKLKVVGKGGEIIRRVE
jgi:hypothetical protein